MKQSTSFAQVVTNLLNVLQGYSKTIRLLLVMFLTLTASAQVWGAEVTVNWTASSGALGSGIGSGTIKTGTFSWNYTRTLKSGTSYTGWGSNCIQLGKNGGVENIIFTTSAIPGTIKKVSIECASYQGKHNVAITVGGNSYLSSTATSSWTTVSAKSGSGTSSGTIQISLTGGTRALYIKSISVTYEEAAATVPVTGVSLNKSSLTLTEGDSETLTTTVAPANATDKTVTWSTSDANFATVSNGKVTAVAAGSATITVKTKDGNKTATCNVTVNPKPKYTVTLKDDDSELTQSIAGGSVTLPPREGCEGYTFAGWTNTWIEDQTTWTTTAPTIISAGSYTPTANVNLYPVYTKTEITESDGKEETKIVTLSTPTTTTSGYKEGTKTDSEGNTWSYYAAINNQSGTYEFGLNSNSNNYNIGSPIFDGKVSSVSFKARNGSSSEARKFLFCSTNTIAQPTKGDLAEVSIPKSQQFTNIYTADLSQSNISQFYIYAPKALGITAITVTYTTSIVGATTTTTSYISVPECNTETTISLYPNFDSKLPTVTTTGATTYTVPPCTLSRTGYTFSHWDTKADGTGADYYPNDEITLDGTDVNLYAIWTPIEYQITYEGLGGASNEDNPTIYTIESETITFEEPGDRAGYIFKGWEPATIEKGSTGPITVTAKWCELLGDATELAVDLNFINVENGETYVKFSWTPADNTKSHATKQVICIGKVGEEKKCTDLEGNQVWSGDLRSKLTPGEYEWTIQAIGDGETYCDGKVISGPNFTIEEELTDNCRWIETEIEDIEPEDEVVVTMTGFSDGNLTTWALGNDGGTSKVPDAVKVDVLGAEIRSVPDNIKWNISSSQEGYILYPNGSKTTWLYCTKSDHNVKVGKAESKIFTIEDGYLKHTNTDWYGYLGVNASKSIWGHYTTIAGQTLKFYKKTCLPANKFWIDYELANVTCTSEKPAFVGADTEIELSFSAYPGYKLPEQVSITMGGNTLSEEAFAWEAEEGILYIVPKDGITGDIVITVEGCELLAIPTNLKADNITSSSATLSWDEIDHATEYQVHITDDDDSTEDIITTTSNTYYEVTGLSSASEYLWGITPIASGYCGLTQEAEIFTTLDVYTVTFNSNGGTAVDPQTVDHGTKATKPTDPTKTGYKFAGWYTEADAEFDFNTPIESATTLYAKWNANQYTITFRQQWGNGGTETATVHFDNNDFSVSPITVPTRNGYTFGGYYTAESGAGTQLIDVSGAWLNAPTYIEGGNWVYADNLTLYAKWTQNFTITWKANGQLYHTQTAMMGTAIAKPDDPDEFACNDKVFVGWLDKTISGSTNEEPTFVTDFGTIQVNKTYHAVFATLTGTPSNDYNQITDINNLTDGEYVIAYSYDGGTQVVLKNTTKDAKYMNASALAPSSNKYTSPSAEYIWQLQKQDDGSYYMYNSSVNKFLYATTSALQLSDNPTKYNISYDNTYSHWKIKLSDNASYYMHGYVSGSSYDFRVSTSGSGNKYRVYLYKNASTAVYSDYVTTCVEIPTPHWEGAEIDNADIAVDCGTISYKTNASTITFPTDKNYDLTYPITLTASEGFLLSTNKQNDIYEHSVTVTPVQSDEHGNKGKITQPVYVRADATGKKTNFDGTITISGDQLAEDQIIEVHAVVDCPQYTLTFNDCGDTRTISNFAGTSVEEMEPWAETCSEPVQYVFDGWAETPVANGTEEYEKINFSTYTMPDNNTTVLYAVYRYAEEGGEPVNGYVKVTEALSDWSGDYVIVNETAKKAIGNAYANKNTNTLTAVDVEIKDDKVISPSENVIWQIRKSGSWYTMYNATAEKYAYITQDKSEAAGLDNNSQNLSISFNNGIVKIYGETIPRCFSYYSTNTEWRTYSTQTYSTGALYRLAEKTIRYTSSLVCGTIEAKDAIVTSTVGQTVKVYVPITLKYSDATSITGTSDSEAFTVVTKNDVAVGESNIEVHYKPTDYVNTANQEETATITLTTSNGATTTFNVTGRCLPENFAIVAQVGNVWYALPSQGLNSETTPVGYPVAVDNIENPTAVTSLPTKAEWALRNVYKVNGPKDRFADHGENLVFVNAETKTLYANNGNANIQTYAEYTNYAENNPDRYEWIPSTTDLTTYTLKNVGRDKDLSINVNATFGTHASNVASSNLRFLPIETTYTPFDMQVVEWYPTKVLVQTETALNSVSATVGGEAVASPVVTKKGAKLYEISGLPLENNPTEILTISYDTYSCSKVIPIIISREEKTVADAPFSTLTTSAYNYSDLIVRDGATLTINGTKQAPDKFVNVTIYPTAKIVVPESNQLNVYSLTFFGGISEIYNGSTYELNKYGVPQLSLKGTLGKTVTTMDYIMRVNLDQMYQVGVPYDVDLNDITYWDGKKITLGDALYVSAYDGQARANREKKTWIYETNFESKLGSATLKAGVGYTISAEPQAQDDKYSILRMPMKSNIASGSSEEAKTINVVAYDNDKGVTITDNHKGWNYLSNPYMTTISGGEADTKLVLGYLKETGTGPWEWVETTQRYVTIPRDNGKDYYQKKFSEAELKPFKSFFVQIAQGGELSFALASRQNAPARLLRKETTPSEIEFELLLSNATQSDNTGLLISEEYTPAYEINADLEKMMSAMSVYTIYNGYNLAYNALSPLNAKEQIPVGYIVPAEGEYTLELDPNSDLDAIKHIYLMDYDMGVTTDLINDAYTFYAADTKSDKRFAINIELSSDIENKPTGFEDVGLEGQRSYKFIYDGILYIMNNGVIYSTTGQQLNTMDK